MPSTTIKGKDRRPFADSPRTEALWPDRIAPLGITSLQTMLMQMTGFLRAFAAITLRESKSADTQFLKEFVNTVLIAEEATTKASHQMVELLVGQNLAQIEELQRKMKMPRETARLFEKAFLLQEQTLQKFTEYFAQLPTGTTAEIVAWRPQSAGAVAAAVASATAAGSTAHDGEDDSLAKARRRGAEYRTSVLKRSDMLSGEDFGKKVGGGVTRQAVDKKRKAGELFALSWGSRKIRYPEWQAEPEIYGGTLTRVLALLKYEDSWTIYRFFTTPEGALGDLTPLDALRQGRVDEVVLVADEFAHRD